MSKITFGKKIDMNLEGTPPDGSNLVAYHSGGGTFSNGDPMIQGMLCS